MPCPAASILRASAEPDAEGGHGAGPTSGPVPTTPSPEVLPWVTIIVDPFYFPFQILVLARVSPPLGPVCPPPDFGAFPVWPVQGLGAR